MRAICSGAVYPLFQRGIEFMNTPASVRDRKRLPGPTCSTSNAGDLGAGYALPGHVAWSATAGSAANAVRRVTRPTDAVGECVFIGSPCAAIGPFLAARRLASPLTGKGGHEGPVRSLRRRRHRRKRGLAARDDERSRQERGRRSFVLQYQLDGRTGCSTRYPGLSRRVYALF